MPRERPKVVFVVATSQKEAESIAHLFGFDRRSEASERLRLVQASPTDPFYAQQYKIFEVPKVWR